jgi:DNA repair protein RadC
MRSAPDAGRIAHDLAERIDHEPRILVEATRMTIKDWPEAERPRERLLAHGPQALSDAELIALFLRTGLAGRTALDLARDALARFGGLSGLLAAAPSELAALPGLGPAKSTQLQAVLELARRSLREDVRRDTVFGSPGAVRDYLRLTLAQREHEVFIALFLDAQNRLLAAEELFRGTLTQTSVYPREVVKRALALNAAALIFAHNHPSGLAEPSRSDELLTASLKQALSLVDVRVLDHLIVAGASTVSFAERGLL